MSGSPSQTAVASRRDGDPVHAPEARPRTAWLFPGLGARFVGMGADVIGQHPAADALIAQAGGWLGYDVPGVCLEGSGRKLVPPRQEAQVIYVIDCAYAVTLLAHDLQPLLVCGHSLGAWAAAYAAGAYDFLTGLELLTRTEDLMEAELDGRGHAMGVVIGLPQEQVEALCRDQRDTYVANYNSPGQYVIAGPGAGVNQVLAEADRAKAYKVKRLPTTRAIHTPLAQVVSERLSKVMESAPLRRPWVPLVSGYDGTWLEDEAAIRDYLARAISLPVCWEQTVRSLRQQGIGEFVEVGPGAVLSGLMSFIDKSASIRTVSEVMDEVLSA